MNNLILTVNAVLPIFLLMIVGYICKQTALVTPGCVKEMNKLVFKIFLPVSLAKSLMNMDANIGGRVPMVAACMIGIFAIFLASMFVIPKLVPENERRGVMVQALFRGNCAILGVPLGEALFPGGDGGVIAMMIMATVPLFNVLAVFTLEYFRGGTCNFKKVLLGVLKNPLIWGCAIGFAIGRLPFDMPQFALSTVDKLAGMASPLALFTLGATIDLKKLGSNARILFWGVSSRLVFIPAALLAVSILLGFRGAEIVALLIAFATPSAVSSYTMAAQMDGDAELAAQMVMLTSVFSSLTIFLFVFVMKSLGVI